MEDTTKKKYQTLIAKLNNHENNQFADMLTITAFMTTIFEISLHVSRMLKRIPTKDLHLYENELKACGYDIEFIKSLR